MASLAVIGVRKAEWAAGFHCRAIENKNRKRSIDKVYNLGNENIFHM